MYPLPIAQIARFIQEDYWLCDVGRSVITRSHITKAFVDEMVLSGMGQRVLISLNL